MKNINEYQELPFEDDYYSYVVKKHSDTDMTPEELQIKRESFKKSTMYILFDGDRKHRNNNPMIRYMNECFPGVNKWLESILEKIGETEFSYILQRTESYFLLNNVSRHFNQKYPNAPIFTIHDGLYTFDEYVDPLKNLMLDQGKRLTGIVPGIKKESPEIETIPTQKVIEKYWKKANSITTPKKFEKKKRSVFQANIDRYNDFFKITL